MIYDGYERPTDHYDERLKDIDEQLCALIEQRKILSDNTGIPTEELVSTWAEKYHFHEDFLNGLFTHLFSEIHFQPALEPSGFVKNIPVLKSTEKDGLFYSITFIRQYENASIVNLIVDAELFENEDEAMMHDQLYKQIDSLIVEDPVGTQYICRNHGGGGFSGYMAAQYIIAPPLPDDLTGVKLIFKEEQDRANQNHTGIEILIGENKDL